MILTCPDCATSYFVDDARIPRDGRTVRCAACGARWTATPQADADLDDLLEPPAPQVEEAPAATAAAPEPEPAAPLVEDPTAERRAALRAEAEAVARRRRRELTVNLSIWGGLAALTAVLFAAAILMRVDVVRLWPRTAGAYAAVGLPVNTVGLEIENLKLQAALQDGHAATAVSGALRNITDHPVVSPALRLRMMDSEGRTLTTNIARPADAKVPAGQSRHFAVLVLDTPVKAKVLSVDFAPKDEAGDHEKAAAPLPPAAGHASDPHG